MTSDHSLRPLCPLCWAPGAVQQPSAVRWSVDGKRAMHKIQGKKLRDGRKRGHVKNAGCPTDHVPHTQTCQIATTNIAKTMDAFLVLISLSLNYAYAASPEQYRRFVKRQQSSPSSSSSSLPSSSGPTQSPTSATTQPSSEHPLPTSIQTRIPIYPHPDPSGVVQTGIPQPPERNSDKGPIIGFSIGVVALVLLFAAAGWILFRRYKRRREQQAASQNAVQLQPTNNYTPSITKNSLDDTQSTVSHK